jgi:hypothetical protein
MFRFTIRDLLWLTVVVAIAAYSQRDRMQYRRMAADLLSEREQLQKEKARFEQAVNSLDRQRTEYEQKFDAHMKMVKARFPALETRQPPKPKAQSGDSELSPVGLHVIERLRKTPEELKGEIGEQRGQA